MRSRTLPGLLAWWSGLLVAFHPFVLSAGDRVPGGRDSLLVGVVLENSWLVVSGAAPLQQLWSPPIFWPTTNAAAFTDLLLGSGPFYWIWRLCGIGPDLAFVFWLTACFSASFLLFGYFLRVDLGLSEVPACCGAWLFAFGSNRVASIDHPHLQANFWWLIAFIALFRWLRSSDATDGPMNRRWVLLAVFVSALSLQAWTAFYPFFFFGFLVAMAAVLSLPIPGGRHWIVALFEDRREVFGCALLGCVILWPLAAKYLETFQALGGRPWGALLPAQPRIVSWFLMGPNHWLSGFLYDLPVLEAHPGLRRPPHANGLGPLTMTLAAIGFWRSRGSSLVKTLVAVTGVTVMLATLWPGGFSIWKWIHVFFPGAQGIRAVGRIGAFLLLPAGIGLAFFVRDLQNRTRGRRQLWIATALIAILLPLEHLQLPKSWSLHRAEERSQALALALASFPEGRCKAWVTAWEGRPVPTLDEDAMRTAVRVGLPTLNGRYGNDPEGWMLRPKLWKAAGKNVGQVLGEWLEAHDLDGKDICTVAVAPREQESLEILRTGDLASLRTRPAT